MANHWEKGAPCVYKGGEFWVVDGPFADEHDGVEVVRIESDGSEQTRVTVATTWLDESRAEDLDLALRIASDALSYLADVLADPSVDDGLGQLRARLQHVESRVCP